MNPSPARSQTRPLALVDRLTLDKECPLCEQPISRERLVEIQQKLQADQAKQARELEERLRTEHQAEREEQLAKHQAEIAAAAETLRVQLDAAEEAAGIREDKAREAAQTAAGEAVNAAQIAAREAQEQLAELQKRVEEKAEEARRMGHETAMAAAADELGRAAAEKEEVSTRLAATSAELESTRDQYRALESSTSEKLEAARAVARDEVLSEVAERVSKVEEERDRVTSERSSLLERISSLEKAQEDNISAAITKTTQEVREFLEAEHRQVIARKESEAFAEKQKLQGALDDLKRQLEKKTADELGEGAEVDLFNTLLAEFPGDNIDRIVKGEAGADIRHVVVHNGHECGSILYDSKNRKQWRTQFASKLRSDQMADRADHAILATRAFPAKASQLTVQEGVILANPARVAAVVRLLRDSMIELNRLRVSAEERKSKTEAIYDFIVSPRFTTYMERLDEIATKMAELEAKEKKSHDQVWQSRGTLIQSLSKATADLNAQVNSMLHG